MINLPRSTFYYRPTVANDGLNDVTLLELIEGIQDELAGYGYRRVTHELRRRGHVVNHKHKRVARLMKAHNLGIKPRKRFVRTTDSRHDSPIFPNLYRNLIPKHPDVVWVADFTYIRIEQGSATRQPSWTRAAARSWAMPSHAGLTRHWRWLRCNPQFKAVSHHHVASITQTAAASTPAKPTAAPSRMLACEDR